VTGDVLIAQDPAQAGTTQTEAPKAANELSANASTNASEGLSTAHPKPAKRLNARERQMARKSGGYNDKNTAEDGTKPMTAAAKSKVDSKIADKAEDKAEKAKEKAKLKASQKAQKADTKARKISAAKAAKAARG
jgi:hypothetical protein